MSEHRATVEWQRNGLEFDYRTYSRRHQMHFDGMSVPGNAAAENIPATVEHADGVDPEQAFVAALSSCHILWFLHLACQKKWVIERYVDEAVGVLAKEHHALHHAAHEKCYIANSVETEVVIDPC
jgi:organic hydroperoxide reductase OsmC/OhrA